MDASFRKGFSITLVSYILMALSGLLINTVILKHYSARVLGMYNICYAIFIVTSQLAVFGQQFTVLKKLSVIQKLLECRIILHSSLFVAIVIATLVCCVFFLLLPYVSSFYGDEKLQKMFYIILPGIFFFAINKVGIFSLNAMRRMTEYAAALSVRYLVLLISVIVISLAQCSFWRLAYSFFISEACVIIFLCFSLSDILFGFSSLNKSIVMEAVDFGMKSLPLGLLSEFNTRVDVLVLGLWVSPSDLGVYSFVAMFAEGIQQLVAVLKNNINPIMSKLIHDGNHYLFSQFVSNIRKRAYFFGLFVVVGVLIAYELYIHMFSLQGQLRGGLVVLIIMASSIYVTVGILAFSQILVMSGLPVYQSLYVACIMLCNLILNCALVPFFGIVGGAVSVSLSTSFFAAVLLNFLSSRKVGIDILFLKKVGPSLLHF